MENQIGEEKGEDIAAGEGIGETKPLSEEEINYVLSFQTKSWLEPVSYTHLKDVTLSYGKIEAVGDRACGLSVLRGATFNAEKNYYQPDFFSLRAEGEHAVGLLIADGVFSATIQNSLVEGIGSEAYAIKASSDMLAEMCIRDRNLVECDTILRCPCILLMGLWIIAGDAFAQFLPVSAGLPGTMSTAA